MRFICVVTFSLLVTACGGGGGGAVSLGSSSADAGADQGANNPPALEGGAGKDKTASFSIRGVIDIGSSIIVDDDINDAAAAHCSYVRQMLEPLCTNDSPLKPQRLPMLATVIGFASAQGTGTNVQGQRFQSKADKNDYYRIYLDAGSSLYLEVLDYDAQDNRAAGDLDLFATRYDGDRLSNVIYSSNKRGKEGKVEYFSIADAGDYLIHIQAFQGVSKYILKVQPANSSAAVPTPAAFIAGEMVVQTLPANQQQKPRSIQAMPFLQHKNRPQLLKLPEQPIVRSLSALNQNPDISAYLQKVDTLQAIKQAQLSGGFEFAEPNYIRHKSAVPNDEYYPLQWHYPAIDLPQAWDISKGLRSVHGKDVIVAVIDTGVYLKHVDLKSKLVPGYDFISSNIASRDGDGIDNNPDDPGDSDDPKESSWHGTHVAGTVAAATDNNEGVAGVSWGAKIMPIRVLGKDGGSSYDIAQGIRFAAGFPNDSGTLPKQRADILNLSLGSVATSESERLAIRDAIEAGVMVVAAAGNEGVGVNNYPAAYPDVIAVSATRRDGQRASYSNYGGYIRVAAPGGEISEAYNDKGIASTYVEGHVDNLGRDTRVSTYSYLEGTSMATPHVAGVLALMKAVNPALTQYDILNLLSSCEITNKKGKCDHDIHFGYGLINAYLAVQAAQTAYSGTQSALLVSSAPHLSLHTLSSGVAKKIVTLTNYGRLKASDIRLSSNVAWLKTELTPANTDFLNVNGNLQVTAVANPRLLSAGRHKGELTVQYRSGMDQKHITIGVTLEVGVDSQLSTLTQHYVLLVKGHCANTNSCVVVDVVAPERKMKYGIPYAEYRFTRVPAGQYQIVAASDIDRNNLLLEAGELLGVYPGGDKLFQVDRDITGANISLYVSARAEPEAVHLKKVLTTDTAITVRAQ